MFRGLFAMAPISQEDAEALDTRSSTPVSEAAESESAGPLQRTIGLILGPLAFLTMVLTGGPADLDPLAWRVAAVGVLMGIWWVTEPVPIPATALLPLILFPLLGVANIEDAAAPYANPVIFLFLWGFLLAEAMNRWELHRRIALLVIVAVGTRPERLVGGFMAATALLGLWVSNTATCVMMMPIGLSVTQRALQGRDGEPVGRGEANFATALLLGIAYASTIGGYGTLIGTPPNALLAGYMRDVYGYEIGFGQWMLLGVPLVALGIPLAWLVLTKFVFPTTMKEIPGGDEAIRLELRKLGRWTKGEKLVCGVFFLTAGSWIARPLLDDFIPGLSDAGIGVIAALLLFLLPVDRARRVNVISWSDAKRVPWDVLLLFGGGLSLADSISGTGLANWIGANLTGLSVVPVVVMIAAITALIIFLSEFTSNTATAAAFLPVVGSLAVALGVSPILLTAPAALAANSGFMMPVGTPPNAIVYATGRVSMKQMIRVGFILNILFATLITIFAVTVVPALFAP